MFRIMQLTVEGVEVMANRRQRQRSKAVKLIPIPYEVASEEEVKKAMEGIRERNAELLRRLAK